MVGSGAAHGRLSPGPCSTYAGSRAQGQLGQLPSPIYQCLSPLGERGLREKMRAGLSSFSGPETERRGIRPGHVFSEASGRAHPLEAERIFSETITSSSADLAASLFTVCTESPRLLRALAHWV
jgi:hypothetical protein